MHILVIGAGGMLGAKLLVRLAGSGRLHGKDIARVTRYDAVVPPPPPASAFPVDTFKVFFRFPRDNGCEMENHVGPCSNEFFCLTRRGQIAHECINWKC